MAASPYPSHEDWRDIWIYMILMADTNPNCPWNGYVIVDGDINPLRVRHSAPLWPAGALDLPVSQRTNVTVAEPDGSTGTGPLRS